MDPTRRDVLRVAAATPFLFGLEGCARAPSWFSDALRKIRSEGKPGLVFRLPKDPQRRCGLGHSLTFMMTRTDAEALEVVLGSVPLCLEEEDVGSLLYGARDGDDLLLIDADGRVLDGRVVDLRIDLAAQAAGLLPRSKEPRAAPAAPPLPYGVSIQAGAGGPCAESKTCWGTCGPCGMAVITPRSREFVKFLAR